MTRGPRLPFVSFEIFVVVSSSNRCVPLAGYVQPHPTHGVVERNSFQMGFPNLMSPDAI
jgi:hypothetical protein